MKRPRQDQASCLPAVPPGALQHVRAQAQHRARPTTAGPGSGPPVPAVLQVSPGSLSANSQLLLSKRQVPCQGPADLPALPHLPQKS